MRIGNSSELLLGLLRAAFSSFVDKIAAHCLALLLLYTLIAGIPSRWQREKESEEEAEHVDLVYMF